MSALLWHAEAAEHLAEAFAKEAGRVASADPAASRLLYATGRAHQNAAKSMREKLRAEAQGGTDGR